MIIIYTTCKNKKEATNIAKMILRLKLAACVNFWPISSIYSWKGKMAFSQEVVLFIKTKNNYYKKIETLIKKIHSYKIPCVLSLKIEKGEKNYLKWLSSNL